MKKNQKILIMGAGGLLVLALLYRWYASRSKAAATQAPDPQQQSAADFAALAGTEQSDVAALQGRESQDVADLSGQISTLGGTINGLPTQGDLNSFESQTTGEITGLSTAITALGTTISGLQQPQNITQIIQGGKPPAKITTHKGGAFYKWYVKETGHAPPANLPGGDSNALYQQWKAGVKPPGKKAPPKKHPKPGKGGASGGAAPVRKPTYNTHTTAHQAIVPGHPNGHAGAAVAPSTHGPKPVHFGTWTAGGASAPLATSAGGQTLQPIGGGQLTPVPTATVHQPAPPGPYPGGGYKPVPPGGVMFQGARHPAPKPPPKKKK